MLVEEQRISHRELHNKGKTPCALKIGDVARARVQLQSRAESGIIGKLSYRARGPFIISNDLGNDPFKVQLYGAPESATRKYKNTELYLLLPTLFPSEVLNTIDQRYLDCVHALVVSPLFKPMPIELYNDKWLQSQRNQLKTRSLHADFPACDINRAVFQLHHLVVYQRLNIYNVDQHS